MTGVTFSPNTVQNYGAAASAGTKAAREGYSPADRRSSGRAEVLGFGTVYDANTNMSYGIRAEYAPNSTGSDPVINVTVQKGNGQTETHSVHIREINTMHASDLEMFALCAYGDATGRGTGNTFGSWQTLRVFSQNADGNGYGTAAGSSYEDFTTRKQNWNEIITRMTGDYAGAGCYEQVMDGKALINMLEAIADAATDENDWRTMSCDSWNKLIKNVDDFIEAYKERLKAIRKAQIKAANEAASLAPASHQAAAAQSAWSKVAMLSAMTTQTVDTHDQAQAAASAYQALAAEPDSAAENVAPAAAETAGTPDGSAEDPAPLSKYQEYLLTGTTAAGITSAGETTEAASTRSDNPEEKTWYITAFSQDGIICKACKKGEEDRVLWQINYKDASQFEKVDSFLKRFETDENLTFASNEQFWKDFLNGRINENGFYQFFENSRVEGPEKNDVHVDEAAAYSAYIAPPVLHESEFSMQSLLTGESINVSKSNEYTDAHPVYTVTGRKADGTTYEQTIDIRNVDPENASYLELAALNAYLYDGSMTAKEQLSFMLMQHESGVDMDTRTDYTAIARQMMQRHLDAGDRTHAAIYQAWMDRIQSFRAGGSLPQDETDEASKTAAGSFYANPDLFRDFGPNAPETVRKAWREAAEETGVDGMGRQPDGKLSHISQMMVMQVQNWHRQAPNYTDLLGNSVSSALEAANQALYNLANPLMPDSGYSAQTQAQRLKEQAFFERFIEKLNRQ